MHGHPLRHQHTTTRSAARPGAPLCSRSGAVTWIGRNRALVARSSASGGIDIREVRPAGNTPELSLYLADVVDVIGDRDRVMILGSDAMRVELEREYVTINRRPDRLIDVEGEDEADEMVLVERLEALTAV